MQAMPQAWKRKCAAHGREHVAEYAGRGNSIDLAGCTDIKIIRTNEEDSQTNCPDTEEVAEIWCDVEPGTRQIDGVCGM